MKVRRKHLLLLVGVAGLLVAIVVSYRKYDERRRKREEDILNNLVIDSFEVTNATRDDAVRLIVEKVHALGHPEFRARVYSSGREAPDFHALVNPPPGPAPSRNFSIKLRSIPLEELIRFVATETGSTCVLNGHELTVVPAVGTMQRFRRETILMPLVQNIPEKDMPAWLRANGVQFYEGMAVKWDGTWLEFFGPTDEIELIELIETPTDAPGWVPTKWGIMKYRFYDWRQRTLGF